MFLHIFLFPIPSTQCLWGKLLTLNKQSSVARLMRWCVLQTELWWCMNITVTHFSRKSPSEGGMCLESVMGHSRSVCADQFQMRAKYEDLAPVLLCGKMCSLQAAKIYSVKKFFHLHVGLLLVCLTILTQLTHSFRFPQCVRCSKLKTVELFKMDSQIRIKI